MKQLVLATRNKGKLKEIQALLHELPFEILSVLDFPNIPEVEEDGETLEENALKKARTVFGLTQLPTLADDTGLEVFALGMKPGVVSARYAGENVSYAANNQKLLKELHDIPQEQRQAQFRCVVAYVTSTEQKQFEGICRGHIIGYERGTNGFGYDPIFVPDGFQETFAELSLQIKNEISHRAKAMYLLKNYLSTIN